MSDVVGSRNRLKNKLKFLVGRAKATKGDTESVTTRKQERRGNVKERGSRYKADDPDPTRGLHKRESSRKRISNPPGVKQFASDHDGPRKEVNGKTHRASTYSSQKRKRSSGAHDLDGRKPSSDLSIREKNTNGACRRVRPVYASKSQDVKLPFRKSSSLKGSKDQEDFITSNVRALRKSRVYGGGNDKHPHRVEDRTKGYGVSDYKVRSKAKATATSENRKVGGDDGLLEKHAKHKLNLKKLGPNRRQYEYPGDTCKKKASRKNCSDNSSVVTDDPPRKRKKVIRIDPHDISNKRLDDGISLNGSYFFLPLVLFAIDLLLCLLLWLHLFVSFDDTFFC